MVMQLSQSSSTEQTEVERQIVFESVLDLGTMRPDLLDTYVWSNLKEKELEVHTYDRSKPNCEIRTVAKAPFNEQNVAVEQYDFSSEKPTTVWLSGQEACNAISFFRAAKSMKCDKIHFRLWNKNNTARAAPRQEPIVPGPRLHLLATIKEALQTNTGRSSGEDRCQPGLP